MVPTHHRLLSPPFLRSSLITLHSSLLLDARGSENTLRTSPHMRDVEGHLFRTSGRKGLKGRKGRFDSSTARDDASGFYSEMKSSLKSGRPLRPDVLNHVPCVPQISPTRPVTQAGRNQTKPRKTRKPAPPDTEGDGKKYASRIHRLFAPIPHRMGELPVSGPKGISSNCLPCPAKRVSAYSVVKNSDAPPVIHNSIPLSPHRRDFGIICS